MKQLFSLLILPALAVSAFSQKPFQAETVFQKATGENFQAWVLAATPTGIRYKTTEVSTDFVDAKISDFAVIFLKEPAEYSVAMDLFEARKYKVAQVKFAEVKEHFKPAATLKDNYHTLAAFYEMECMRKQSDFTGLATALKSFVKTPLTRAHQLRQLELYAMWEAVSTKAWDQVLAMSTARDGEVLPGYQRAQVSYCKGLALHGLKRGPEAIVAFNTAIIVDAGASEIITQDAALAALRIYLEDEQVKTAMETANTQDENRSSRGYLHLKEAAALAQLYDTMLKVGKPLPEELKAFLAFGG